MNQVFSHLSILPLSLLTLKSVSWDNAMASYATLPQYFQKYGRKEPQTQDHVPVTFAAGMPELTYYELLKRDHARRERFTKAMGPLEESSKSARIFISYSTVVFEG